jgi:hypothetical protein
MYYTPESIFPHGFYKGMKFKEIPAQYLYTMYYVRSDFDDKDRSIRNFFNTYYKVDEIAIHNAIVSAITLK